MVYWEDVSNMNHYFFTAENPAEGASFTYHLAQPAQKVRLLVANAAGKTIRVIDGPAEAGAIQRVNWDLRYAVPAGVARGGGGGGGGEGGRGAAAAGAGGGPAADSVARHRSARAARGARVVQGHARSRRRRGRVADVRGAGRSGVEDHAGRAQGARRVRGRGDGPAREDRE